MQQVWRKQIKYTNSSKRRPWGEKSCCNHTQAIECFEGGDSGDEDEEKEAKRKREKEAGWKKWKEENKIGDSEFEQYMTMFTITEYDYKESKDLDKQIFAKQAMDGLEIMRLLNSLYKKSKDFDKDHDKDDMNFFKDCDFEFLEKMFCMNCHCGKSVVFKPCPAAINFDFYAYRCRFCKDSTYEDGEFVVQCSDDSYKHDEGGPKYHLNCFLKMLKDELNSGNQ